jgi:hypothetical protein
MKPPIYIMVLAAFLCRLPLAAQPSLQLYIENAAYDSSTSSWFITAPGELRLWVIGNTGAVGPIRQVKLIVFHPAEETGCILLIPITTSLVPDPSIPLTPILAGSGAGSIPLSHGSSILPSNDVADTGNAWKAFALGDFTLTDSPVGDFIYSFPASFPSRGQINVYRVLADGYTSLSFGAAGTVTKSQSHPPVQTCFAPFSHTAGARLTPRRIHFGIGQSWNDVQEMQNLGFEMIRQFVGWGFVQSGLGQPFDWASVDFVVDRYRPLGFDIILILRPDAEWDQHHCHRVDDPLSPPCFPAAWEAFVRAIVERYDGHGIFWEMFNEPSGLTGYSPQDYVQFLAMTYPSIKTACPSCWALQAGDGMAVDGGAPYTETTLSLGAASYFDIASLHFIHDFVFDETLCAAPFTRLLAKYDVHKPVWITEAQIQSGAGACYPHFTEEQGAAEMVKAYVRAFGLGVERIAYTVIKAQPDLPPNMKLSALIDVDGRKRPSYFAMRTMISQLKGFDSVISLSTDPALGRYRFTISGSNVYVFWGSGPLPPEISGTLKVIKLDGSQSVQQASALMLSNEPVFVIK